MKFIMLVGLPGSGKTYFGEKSGFLFLDDLTQRGGQGSVVGLPEGTVVISDFGFILEKTRKSSVDKLLKIYPGSTFEWVVWENNPKACFANIVRRNDGRNLSLGTLNELSKMYTYPTTEIRSVYVP